MRRKTKWAVGLAVVIAIVLYATVNTVLSLVVIEP